MSYGREVMRLVNTKTAGKTYLDLMTDNKGYILQLQQKINLPSLVFEIVEKAVLSEPDNQHH